MHADSACFPYADVRVGNAYCFSISVLFREKLSADKRMDCRAPRKQVWRAFCLVKWSFFRKSNEHYHTAEKRPKKKRNGTVQKA